MSAPQCGSPATCGEFSHEHPHADDVVSEVLRPREGHPGRTDTDARQGRLDALGDWERELLLAYLDGRVPGAVDEWFDRRADR